MKFLPSRDVPLPRLKNGTDITQFYLVPDTFRLERGKIFCRDRGLVITKLKHDEQDIVQNILSLQAPRQVRIRLAQKGPEERRAFFTIKADLPGSKASSPTLDRFEFEKEIEFWVASVLLRQEDVHLDGVVAKTRYKVEHLLHAVDGSISRPYQNPFEIDVFKGPQDVGSFGPKIADNSGLTLIELEIRQGREQFSRALMPAWVGPEVSHEQRFTNQSLSKNPFSKWSREDKSRVLGYQYTPHP